MTSGPTTRSATLSPTRWVRPTDRYCQGIVADWRSIWEDESAAETVRSVNGNHETVPTVRVRSTFVTNSTGRQVRDLVLGRPGTVAYRRRRRLLRRMALRRMTAGA